MRRAAVAAISPAVNMSDDNIWVAASDGKLDRVKVLVLEGGVSVNAQDEQGYSAL